jgi:4'-phosphopantetheinyl transferase
MESSVHVAPIDELESTRFSRREVLIWRIRLNATESALAYYRATLSPEERNRSERFRFENLRHCYIVCRGALRVLLAHYLGCSPKDVEFTFGQKGKPGLRGTSPMRFNVSHSADFAVFAFTLGCELGVDVERLRELAELESIASRFFCAAETSELLSLSPELRGVAFFRCWTRKEAYIKAVGDGLSIPLNRFQVTLLPGDRSRLVHIDNDTQAVLEWTVHDLDLAPEYIGALAYRDSPRLTTFSPVLGAERLPAIVANYNS